MYKFKAVRGVNTSSSRIHSQTPSVSRAGRWSCVRGARGPFAIRTVSARGGTMTNSHRLCTFFLLVIAAVGIPRVSATQDPAASSAGTRTSDLVYTLLHQRVAADQATFAVYVDQDSGFNHGFASGFFGNLATIHIDTGCIDDPSAPNG